MKYAWIKEHDKQFPTAVMSQVLQVSTSGYYAWLERQFSARQQRHRYIAQAIGRSHFESERIYGYRKVHQDLLEADIVCCKETVRRIMREIGLCSRVKRKFVLTTDSKHDMAIAGNLLGRDFTATLPNQKWVADITYIPTAHGWLYLAVVMDLYSRKIVGWSMSKHIDSELVVSATSFYMSRDLVNYFLLFL